MRRTDGAEKVSGSLVFTDSFLPLQKITKLLFCLLISEIAKGFDGYGWETWKPYLL